MINYQLRLAVVVTMMLKLLLLLLQGWGSNACLVEERVALLHLKASFNCPTCRLSDEMGTWGKDVDCCKWNGVGCKATTGRVYKLILDDFRDGESVDNWYFNASMFLPFQELRSLSLRGNSIVCCVNEGFERFANTINLEYLDLSNNELGNAILPSLAGFSSLKSLSISEIRLTRTSGFERLTNAINLEYLDLSNNKLGNVVLSSVASFSSLKSLDMTGIGLKEISGLEELQKLRNLEILHLGDNDLNNSVLPLLRGLQYLKILDISYTQLKGSINMKDLVALFNLEELDVSGNKIDKFLTPKDIEGQSNISVLWLEDGVCNGSSFQLQSLKVFPNLESLHLEYNNFTGVSFSQEINRVKELYLNRSSLDVNFLKSLGVLRSLGTLSMDRMDASQSLSNINTFLQSIVNMTSLETLSLSDFKFTGNIQGLCHFTNLRVLYLSDNNLSGNLPHCLVNLTLLQELDLSDNQFEIPSSLSPFFNHSKLKNFNARGNEVYTETEVVNRNLTPKFQLESLSLSSTSGGGSFPEFLYHQHDLLYLHISGIPMIGLGFPSWLLENNTRLESLDLSNCSLSGSLGFPAHYRNANLWKLDISGNQLYGHIPTEMCAYFPSLMLLDLSENEFTGSIPKSLSNCAFLRALVMCDNKLFDKVPKWIGTKDSLWVLDLAKNMLFGSIPAILGTSRLEQIYLSENRFEGPFPNLISLSNSLQVLDLSYNCLIGIIPKWIEKIYTLKYLFLSHNNFIGEIPINLWKMTNRLKIVNLSHNMFSVLSTNYSNKYTKKNFGGKISAIGENMYAVKGSTFLTISEVGEFDFVLKGNTFGFKLERIVEMHFVGLDLSSNNLKGRIPCEFGNIQGINLLNLSHNSLFGPIPFSFSNMSQIETLDLSCNNLSGTIPRQLTELNFLEVFNVSYNNLSGKTPNRVAQFATFDESSYEGNPFLCGLPLPKNCTSETPTPPSSNDDEVDDELVDMNVFYISFSVTFTIILVTMFAILYINPYWRKAWFYFIEKTIDNCYYFFVDNFSFQSKLGIR